MPKRSNALAILVTYLAILVIYEDNLAPSEDNLVTNIHTWYTCIETGSLELPVSIISLSVELRV